MVKRQPASGARRALRLVASTGVLVLGLSTPALAADGKRIFRYRDAQGVIQLAGVLPPDQAQRGYEVLDATTQRVVSVVLPALTDQQRADLQARRQQAVAADAAARREQDDRQRQAAVRQQRDTMLLQTYASEAELLALRDAKLESLGLIEGTINKTVRYLRSNLAQMDAVMAEHQAAGRDAPTQLRAGRNRTAADLAEQERAAERLQTERAALQAQFEDDLKRYRRLTTAR